MQRQLTILVTGSTDGIGKATAMALAREGHRVLVHGRNKEKGEAVVEAIRGQAGKTDPDLFLADLSSFRQIRGLAAHVLARYPRLDVLINNAGVYMPERVESEDGIEMTLAVNLVAPFLLTRLIRAGLGAAAPARVVNLASSAHFDVDRVDWDDLQAERHYDPWQQYALSKLGVVHFTAALAGRLDPGMVTVNCLHPGVTCTKLLYSAFPDYPCEPPDAGARTPVYLATSLEVAGVTGKYFDGMRGARTSRLARDREVRERFCVFLEDVTARMI